MANLSLEEFRCWNFNCTGLSMHVDCGIFFQLGYKDFRFITPLTEVRPPGGYDPHRVSIKAGGGDCANSDSKIYSGIGLVPVMIDCTSTMQNFVNPSVVRL